MSSKEELALLDKHCSQIGEHFETVQIFVTSFDPNEGTKNASWGSGNWFARYGQIKSWLEKKSEETRVEVRKNDDEA